MSRLPARLPMPEGTWSSVRSPPFAFLGDPEARSEASAWTK